MKELVIFDLDGTLLNTIDDLTKSINLTLDDLKLPNITVEEAKYIVGSGVINIAIRTLKLLLKDRYEELKEKYHDLFLERYEYHYTIHQKDNTKPYDGIVEMLKGLKEKGIKIAVLSNKPHVDTIKVMAYYFPDIAFDFVLGHIDKNRIKPSIDGIIMIEDELDIHDNSKILYVGDTNVDVMTAKNANLEVLACAWGFRKIDELVEANKIIYNPIEVLNEAING